MNIYTLLDEANISYDQNVIDEFEVSTITCDSRKVIKNCVFVAIDGSKDDGHKYIEEAISKGAGIVIVKNDTLSSKNKVILKDISTREAYSVLCSKFWKTSLDGIKFYGVTGTNGKTTSVYLAHHLLSRQHKTGLISTIQNLFPGHTQNSKNTTPNNEEIYSLIAEMRKAGCQSIVIEVSSHALDQDRIFGIEFNGAVITNITRDHLDYHGTIDRYVTAKSKIFSYVKEGGAIVLNHDDEHFTHLISLVSKKTYSFGVNVKSDFLISDINLGLNESSFKFNFEEKTYNVHSTLIGKHNVFNVVGVLALLNNSGISKENLIEGVKSFPGVKGRLEDIQNDLGIRIFVDYAHTADGLQKILESIKPFSSRRLLLLFGCGGDREREKRPDMARIAEQYADHIVVTSDNPRTEKPRLIAEEICSGFSSSFNFFEVQLDRKKAIRQILLRARKNDIVLIVGKGHEEYQIIGDEKKPFSDYAECCKVVEGR